MGVASLILEQTAQMTLSLSPAAAHCMDGRKKPEIVGPGTHDTGGVFQASLANPPGSGNGAAAGLL